ncbi:aminodeoxychorismate/anthranilate synthase component II [Cytophagales bacterium LB-30]|uniref:Aminodeoxychorismate/anthranilate synthase component II n=1 Tax=Shiella aurantiaca TaxID=3058365 RepID=A0ABT8F7M9_9BACT|nr:aminodeoxychorismate/anthranilate synthase component II [Shiella aurantiaca]MDN4166442.1 aminodeoxychorismate/anthranilate synthase component II [Shiella aurantiaca]
MKVLVIDNYDSFTYNLVQVIKETGLASQLKVVRNDAFELSEVAEYDKIVLSPGPSLPAEAGLMPELIKQYSATKSILGVCLGHQAIAEAFGGSLFNLKEVVHGVATPIEVTDKQELLFQSVSPRFLACRYHSWAVAKSSLPADLVVTAEDDQGVIMALRHKHYDVRGVQFHPESVLSPEGKRMINNWMQHKV